MRCCSGMRQRQPASCRRWRGYRGWDRHGLARHGRGAVAGQPVGPLLVACLHRLLDQQAPEAGAIDEQVALDPPAAFQGHGLQEAVLAAQGHVQDLALGARDAARLGIGPQVLGVEGRIELIGVGKGRAQRARVRRRRREPVQPRGDDRQAVGLDPVGLAAHSFRELARPQPVLVKGHPADRLTKGAEGVDVALALASPVAKLDAQLVGRLGLAHEIGLVEAESGVEIPDVRDGRLANADDPDLGGFHQLDGHLGVGQDGAEARSGHPAGGAAADNDDLPDPVRARRVFHGVVSSDRHLSRGCFLMNSLGDKPQIDNAVVRCHRLFIRTARSGLVVRPRRGRQTAGKDCSAARAGPSYAENSHSERSPLHGYVSRTPVATLDEPVAGHMI